MIIPFARRKAADLKTIQELTSYEELKEKDEELEILKSLLDKE